MRKENINKIDWIGTKSERLHTGAFTEFSPYGIGSCKHDTLSASPPPEVELGEVSPLRGSGPPPPLSTPLARKAPFLDIFLTCDAI